MFQRLSSNKSFIENIEKWSSPFEEMDPLLRFEQMDLENVSLKII